MIKSTRIFKYLLLCVCIFYLSYLYSVNRYIEPKKSVVTYSDFQDLLCLEVIKKKTVLKSKCPENAIVTVAQGGRLGNQIWQYASAWAVAKDTGLQPYVPKCIKSTIEVLFQNLSVPTLDENGSCTVPPTVSIRYMKDYNYGSNISIALQKFNVQPEILSKYLKEMAQEFRIKKRLLEQSQDILHLIADSLNETINNFIGIHIRRTDYVEFVRTKYKKKAADLKFYKSAIDYFNKKYENCVFILVTDDPLWAKQAFKSTPNVFMDEKTNSPELDLALLASCNHSIIDYGTFGQWGALLAGGETVFYPIGEYSASDRLSKVLPEWHTLSTV